MRVFVGKHSQDWAEIAENEEICDLHDKNGGLRFFWQLVQLNYALVSQMGCLELFIFENGQPMTTPPPKVYFWAFRLTVTPTDIRPIYSKLFVCCFLGMNYACPLQLAI